MKGKIKLVAFDMDGTLVDSKTDIAFSMNRALMEHGLPERPPEDYGTIVGGGAREAVKRACPAGTPEDIIEAVFDLYKKTYPENCCKKTRVYCGIHELIGLLQKERIVLAVLTNKTHATSEIILDHYFPQKPFSAVLGKRGDIPLKPAADMGEWLSEEVGIPPENTMYIGDSDTDIFFARASGFMPVGAAWGFRGRDELSRAGAEAVIDTPLELTKLIFGNGG